MKEKKNFMDVCSYDIAENPNSSEKILCCHKIGREISETVLKKQHLIDIDETLRQEIEKFLENESEEIRLCVNNNGGYKIVSDKQCAAAHIFEVTTEMFYSDKKIWPWH
ncbi:MAG: hypothetical protein AAB757_00100 [Patescibacteria group bacterium]